MTAVTCQLSFAFVPVNLDVMRRSADGNEISPPVAVEVARREVFDRDTPRINKLPRPFRAGCILWVIDPHTAFGGIAQVVPHANHQLFVLIAVDIYRPDGMPPLQVLIEHMAIPKPLASSRPRLFGLR